MVSNDVKPLTNKIFVLSISDTLIGIIKKNSNFRQLNNMYTIL